MFDLKNINFEEAMKQIRFFSGKIDECHYRDRRDLSVNYTYDSENPIPLEEIDNRSFSSLKKGEQWGELWGSAWMRFEGVIPDSWNGKEIVALIDIDAEGCVFKDGEPVQGLTHKSLHFSFHRKRRYPLFSKARAGEAVSVLVEAAANEIGGQWGQKNFILREAEMAVFDREYWKFKLDYQYLLNLLENLPPRSTRGRKIMMSLLKISTLWKDGKNLEECSALTEELLSMKAVDSALTAYSQGHAHIDIAWLWPIRETRRKAVRTFSTALKLMEEYPEYCFGASQPQLYQWIREDYPQLYRRIKEAVRSGRWECQGAMWVEPDMNLISGESMVRQCIYGLQFFREEFGQIPRNLWLPDVFGFSSALPQILKKCGVDHFLSIKMSWNDTNDFPHSTFWWKGIDGTSVLTHFPPAREYHTSNKPKDMIFSEENFRETGICDSFINLYGIGDGGGGPSREHVEYGLRGRDCEGVPRLRFERADQFFNDLEKSGADDIPCWDDELYLEFHRGTYTSQSKLKKMNREIEHLFRDIEFFSAVTDIPLPEGFDGEWKTLLLHQFHDILPGSSIERVNREARESLSSLKRRLIDLRDSILESHCFCHKDENLYTVFNTLSWGRECLVSLPIGEKESCCVYNSRGEKLDTIKENEKIVFTLPLPSMGYEVVRLEKGDCSIPSVEPCQREQDVLENTRLRIVFENDGSISSFFDKKLNREWLRGSANKLLLWDDEPYRWDAWEITPFYRESEPEEAELLSRTVSSNTQFNRIVQKLKIGKSEICQVITLQKHSSFLEICNHIDWYEDHKMLKAHCLVNSRVDYATYEIQYGTVRRSTRNNNSWQQAQFEVPGQRFADLSDEKEGFALINDSSYGYRIKDGEMEQTLLRSPSDPDEKADRGHHVLSFGYLSHERSFSGSEVLRTAHSFNSPPAVIKGCPDSEVKKSFFTLKGGNVKIEVVKPSINKEGKILRLYETSGLNQDVILRAEQNWEQLVETDLLESGNTVLSRKQDELSLHFNPFEIRTFLLT